MPRNIASNAASSPACTRATSSASAERADSCENRRGRKTGMGRPEERPLESIAARRPSIPVALSYARRRWRDATRATATVHLMAFHMYQSVKSCEVTCGTRQARISAGSKR